MNRERLVKGICKWEPLETRNAGRLKNRWENYVMKNLNLLKIKHCTTRIQNREEWRIVEKVRTFKE
jgi:hypothetical protein